MRSNPLAANEPTGAVWLLSQPLPQLLQLALALPTLSPQAYAPSVLARAAYSHSASDSKR